LVRAALRKQTDLSGNAPLDLQLAVLVVPAAIETTAQQLIGSTVDPAKNNATVNPFANKVDVIGNPRLDKVSSTAWYGGADPNMYDGVEVCFLEGEDGPVMEEMDTGAVDGRAYKCRHVVAARMLDFRGWTKNPGA
jgi:hypothetical protein